MRDSRIGFLIADGEHARLVVRDPETHTYRTAWTRTAAALRHGAATHDAPPPRVHESVGKTRHAVTPRTDPHDKAKVSFAHAVAEAASAVAAEAHCDPVAIVAPARLMPDFRAGLATGRGPGSEAFDLAKDLTKTRDEDLPDHLDPVVRSIAAHRRAAS